MYALNVQEFYERHIKPLTPAERLRLLEITAHDLAQIPALSEETPQERPTGLTQFIGAAQGSFTTPAEADAFIRLERGSWDS